MQDPTADDLIIAPPGEEELERLRALAELLDTAAQVSVRCDDGDAVELPESAREGLERLVGYLAADMAVTMKPYDEILTTREAAEPGHVASVPGPAPRESGREHPGPEGRPGRGRSPSHQTA